MFRNQLLVGLRALIRSKTYSAINIFGLAVGLAVAASIFSWVQHELGYDRQHEKYDRIYRIVRETSPNGGSYSSGTIGRLGPALKTNFPEIEEVVRMSLGAGYTGAPWVKYNDRLFPQAACTADSSIFRVFTLPLAMGDPETALHGPDSVVLTREMVRKFFGDEDPIGKHIHFGRKTVWDHDYRVTGVLEDLPSTMSYPFPFDCLVTTVPKGISTWGWYRARQWGSTIQTFVLVRPQTDVDDLSRRIASFRPDYVPEGANGSRLSLQPLSRVHLYTNQDYGHVVNGTVVPSRYGSIQSVFFLGSIAVLVLLIACINFVNLSTARATRRAHEIGVRKVAGATRTQLIRQHLLESVLMTLLAGTLAFGLVQLSHFIGFETVQSSPTTVACVIAGMCLTVGICAGAYPAFYLSRFDPVRAFRGQTAADPGNQRFRSTLVLAQFAVSIFLLIGTFVVSGQMRFIREVDRGIDTEYVVMTDIFRSHTDRTLIQQYDAVKRAFMQHPNVIRVTGYKENRVGLGPIHTFPVRPEGWTERVRAQRLEIDEDFLETMDLQLLEGQNLGMPGTEAIFVRRAYPQPVHILVNETAVKRFGWDADDGGPIGKTLDSKGFVFGIVVGVVEDFHTQSLHAPIAPTFMYRDPTQMKGLFIRIDGRNVEDTMAFLNKTWKTFIPERPSDFVFLDEHIGAFYAAEQQVGRLMTIFSALAILIGCLGLIGLVAFEVEQRVREVGIRRVLGASTSSILRLFTSKFTILILVANVIAWPVAWKVMDHWLQRFAYRIDLEVPVFASSAAIVFAIAAGTVCVLAMKAAMAHPADALRNV